MLVFLCYAKENVSYSEGVALMLSNEAEKTLLEWEVISSWIIIAMLRTTIK